MSDVQEVTVITMSIIRLRVLSNMGDNHQEFSTSTAVRLDSGFYLRFRELERHLTLLKLSDAFRYRLGVFIHICGIGDRLKVGSLDRLWVRKASTFSDDQ